jgi:effector-binding domain-containing protein
MSVKIEIVERASVLSLTLKTRCAVEMLPTVIGESYGKIIGYMNQKLIHPAGPPYVGYFNEDMSDLDIEIGFPVDNPVEETEELVMSSIPGGNYIYCFYKGSYENMQEPYGEIDKYMAAENLQSAGVAYEIYLNAPQEVPPDELLTEILIAVK